MLFLRALILFQTTITTIHMTMHPVAVANTRTTMTAVRDPPSPLWFCAVVVSAVLAVLPVVSWCVRHFSPTPIVWLQSLHWVQLSSVLQQYTSLVSSELITVGSDSITSKAIIINYHEHNYTISREAQSSANLSNCCVAQTSSTDPSPLTAHTHLQSAFVAIH